MNKKVFEIVAEVAEQSGVPGSKILGRGRTQTLVNARRAAVRRCRAELKISYPELGEIFDGRNHTTMLNYVKNNSKFGGEKNVV